ncbi:uncharacterized protein V6R79_009563 [Siganus canaliculatus]
MHFLILIFGVVLLPEANTLKCHGCRPDASNKCTDSEIYCAAGHVCASKRIISFAGTSKLADIEMKTCVLPEQCVESSINYGFSRNIITFRCCNTDLCNTQRAPDHTNDTVNDKQCYHCDKIRCSDIIHCKGNENHCFSKTVPTGDPNILKGCATAQMCSERRSTQMNEATGGELTCCEGNLCNSAGSSRFSLLLLLSPLISLVTFS